MTKTTGFKVEITVPARDVNAFAIDLADRIWENYSHEVLVAGGYTSEDDIAEQIVNNPSFHKTLKKAFLWLTKDQEDAITDFIYDNDTAVSGKIIEHLEEVENQFKKNKDAQVLAEKVAQAKRFLEQEGFQVTK